MIHFDKSHLSWLEERIILLAVTGSHAYGTETENSDRDYRGVCIPPIEYYLGLAAFNEYNNSGGKNFRNTKDDIDIRVMHINKFVKDALQGVPNNIELLFVRKEDFLRLTALGQELVNHRHLFLSKRIYKRFGGYASAQMQKLKTKKTHQTGRQDLVQRFGYDTKFFMHSVRLLTSAIEILETGEFSTYRPNRQLLLDCRFGKYSYEEALKLIDHYDQQLKKAYEHSSLPANPDYDRINRLLIEINRQALEIEQ